MKSSKSNQPVLGVMVTSRTVHAVLVQAEASDPVVIQRFVRQRNARPVASAMTPSMASMVPELQEELSGQDFTIQFGDGASKGGNELFMKSEFSGFQAGAVAEGAKEPSGDRAANFMYELAEILEECREAGFEKPQIAFCVTSSEVAHLEVQVVPKAKRGAKDAGTTEKAGEPPTMKTPGREQLLALVKEQNKSEYDPETVGFLPMVPSETGALRYVAFVPKKGEPVSVTLQALRKQKEERSPNVRLLDGEGSLFVGLARRVLRSLYAPAENARVEKQQGSRKGAGQAEVVPAGRRTLVVRAGAEDTLLFFMDGERLRHYENMRSLTAFDSPDTICSRVLLQQDEYGVEEIHHVLLLSEDREDQLVESFKAFFPEADVTALRNYLPGLSTMPGQDASSASLVAAVGVALRLIDGAAYRTAFEEVNFLSKRLIRQKIELPFTWHMLALSVLLFGTALFFGSRYILMEQEIDTYRDMLRQYPPTLADEDPRVLQARIDSMQNLYNGYMHALAVLDTLLIGSDQWSRSLEELSRETAAVRGVWVETWQPGPGMVALTGNATTRDRVVELAERLDGSIHSLTFSEIREWPVYSFSMQIPIDQRLPEAAKYLRERALTVEEARDGLAPAEAGSSPGIVKQTSLTGAH